MNKNIKLRFTKSKAYGLCGVILTAALMMVMAPHAYADEATTTPATETVATTETPATTEATPTTETPATTEATPATTTEATPATTETPATTAATADETPTISTGATEITKEGDTITVKNPDVDMHFTKSADGNGTGKYVNFKVEYKDIKFPDSMAINQGD